MKKLLLIAFLLSTGSLYAQYIKLDNGIVSSSFHNEKNLSILSSKKIVSYSFLLGTDYLEKGWFYLSSQIGYIKIGGKEKNSLPQEEYNSISESGSFIHLNTTFRAYIKASESRFFVGIGPYINISTGNKNFDSPLYSPSFSFKNLYVGGKPEIGATVDINKFRVGLTGTYMFNLSPSAASEFISLYNNAFSAMATVAYRIR